MNRWRRRADMDLVRGFLVAHRTGGRFLALAAGRLAEEILDDAEGFKRRGAIGGLSAEDAVAAARRWVKTHVEFEAGKQRENNKQVMEAEYG